MRDGKWLPLTLGVIPLVTYVLTWLDWLITNTGYDGGTGRSNTAASTPVISPLYSLFEYLQGDRPVHDGPALGVHPYMSQPWDWFVISRPVAFYWVGFADPAGQHVWTKPNTVGPYAGEVLALGNPAIWWISIPVMVFCLGWWLTRRDWRAGAALLGIAAGWATWLPFVSRTKFDYYALEFEPFLIICIVLCLGLILGSARSRLHRAIGSVVVGLYVVAVLVVFWYFYPILTGQVIPYSDWLSHYVVHRHIRSR